MADNDLEGRTPQTESGGEPNQPDPQAGASSSVEAESLEAVLDKVRTLEGMVKSFQSGKDKGQDRLESQVANLSEQLARYETLRAQGLEPAKAEREMILDDIIAERRTPQEPTPGKPRPAASVEAQTIAKALGLNENDPEVVKTLRDHPDNVLEQVLGIANLARTRQSTQPNPAAVQTAGGGAAVSSEDELSKQYQSEKSKIKRGSQAANQLMALKQKYRENARRLGIEEGPWS